MAHICKKCGQDDLSEFSLKRGKPSGLCKSCRSKDYKSRLKARTSLGLSCAHGVCPTPAIHKTRKGTWFCRLHYDIRQKEALADRMVGKCSHEGCTKKAHALVRSSAPFCRTHYSKHHRDKRLAKGIPCGQPGCKEASLVKGLCSQHYIQVRKAAETRTCSLCTRPLFQKSWCLKHYTANLRKGDPLAPSLKAPPCEVSRLDYHGYVVLRGGRKEHRVVMEGVLGRTLTSEESVHHLNGNRADNRADNLELWLRPQPKGQRPKDKVVFAQELLETYKMFHSSTTPKHFPVTTAYKPPTPVPRFKGALKVWDLLDQHGMLSTVKLASLLKTSNVNVLKTLASHRSLFQRQPPPQGKTGSLLDKAPFLCASGPAEGAHQQ